MLSAFNKLRDWFRKAWSKMISNQEIERMLATEIDISPEMAKALTGWNSLYLNQPEWVDNVDVFSMNLPAVISSEIARLVTIEMQVNIKGGARAEFLTEQFKKVFKQLRKNVEYGCAKGGIIVKPYIENDTLSFDYFQADEFLPISFDADGNLVGVIFIDQRIHEGKYYTRLEKCEMITEGYLVTNRAFVSSDPEVIGSEIELTEFEPWEEIEPEVLFGGIVRPLFAYFKYPAANNIDPSSNLGVSCFARATEIFKQADEQWSRFLWEHKSAERALYVDVLAFDKDPVTDEPILPNRRLYKTLNMTGEVNDENMFNEWSPTIREQEILDGLNAILRRIEFNCGLAYGVISDVQVIAKTATEVDTSQQRSYVTVSDTQKELQDMLEHLIWAMDMWTSIAQLATRGVYDTSFVFDDSILVDSDAKFNQDSRALGLRVMGRVEFRVRNYKEDVDTAKAKIAEIDKEQPLDVFGANAGV